MPWLIEHRGPACLRPAPSAAADEKHFAMKLDVSPATNIFKRAGLSAAQGIVGRTMGAAREGTPGEINASGDGGKPPVRWQHIRGELQTSAWTLPEFALGRTRHMGMQ